jgi:voltage-gated potassium channel
VNERARQLEKRLEVPLLFAALLTIPVIAIQLSSTGPTLQLIGDILNWTTWLAFVTEIVLMLRVVDDKKRWLRDHPLDLAIVLLTPPLLPEALQSARIFRLLAVLRLFRAAGLARALLTTEGVKDAAVLALLTILGGGVAFAAVERGYHDPELTAWDGVWWAMQTVTTVGYGDPPINTDAGRMIAIVVMSVGIGFVAIITAAAAERFMEGRHEREELREKLDEILRRLDERSGQ